MHRKERLQFNLSKGCQMKSTLVGYPYVLQGTETDGVLPANVNDSCWPTPSVPDGGGTRRMLTRQEKGLPFWDNEEERGGQNAPTGSVKAVHLLTGQKRTSSPPKVLRQQAVLPGGVQGGVPRRARRVRDKRWKVCGEGRVQQRGAFTTPDGGAVKGCTWNGPTANA